MARKSFREKVESLTTDQRLEAAKKGTEQLTQRIQEILEIHSINKIINYSDLLSKQIPPSRAAISFNRFTDAMFKYEIIRLLALWDPPVDNAVSIPTVLLLINDPKVIRSIRNDIIESHDQPARILNPSDDPAIQEAIEAAFRESENRFAARQAEKGEQELKACIVAATDFVAGELHEGLKNLRDHVAHSVTQTRREISGNSHKAKYGYERMVLERTINILEDLYCWVNGVSFDISGNCSDIADECAKELWSACTFSFETNET